MIDGMIGIDSPVGQELGFISRDFAAHSYLWKKGLAIWVSLIESKYPGRGNLRRLLATIYARGFDVVVPTVFPRMQMILTRLGYQPEIIVDDVPEPMECYCLRQPPAEKPK